MKRMAPVPDMNREIGMGELGIIELVHMLAENRLLVPSFQREFVWEPEDIIKLWDSIYRFYPIGSLLCWETHVYLRIHRRAGGHILPDEGTNVDKSKRWLYILDGQQRATALLVSILGEKAKAAKRRDFDYTLYFDAIGGTFFFGNELGRHKKHVDQAFLIRLKDIYEKRSDFPDSISADTGCSQGVENHLIRLYRVFLDYKIPLIRIRGFDIPAVREIFERINQEGKSLKSIDIMIARTFQNYDYMVEEGL